MAVGWRRTSLSARTDELVRDAARRVAEGLLGLRAARPAREARPRGVSFSRAARGARLLADERLPLRVCPEPVDALEQRRGGNLERGGGGEAAAERHVGDDGRVEGARPSGQHRQHSEDDAAHIVRPVALWPGAEGGVAGEGGDGARHTRRRDATCGARPPSRRNHRVLANAEGHREAAWRRRSITPCEADAVHALHAQHVCAADATLRWVGSESARARARTRSEHKRTHPSL